MITGTTRLYAIIGDPIGHVRTPMAFNDYFAARGIDAVCLPIHIGRDDLARGWAGLHAILNLDGFIVTAPHKQESARLCDALADDCAHTKVVNAVRREPDGRFTGTLLDGRGFVSGMTSHGHAVEGRRFYIAGAGGAGTALAYALAHSGADAITIHNRTRWKAENLVAGVGQAYPACKVRLGNADASGHDVVVNATSLGLKPDDPLSFDLNSADRSALVAEVVMKPEMTPLLIAAERAGHAIHFGTHMLNGQLELMMRFFHLAAPAGQGTRFPFGNESETMTYVVVENCIKCKYTDCVEVCPVDCFYEGENMLVIHPDECIDCGVCVPECPAEAIKPDTDPGLEKWLALNAELASIWPNITKQKEPPADAKEHDGMEGKFDKFYSREPGS